jgi:hypothetical protein
MIKSIIKNLEKQKDKIQELIEHREMYVENRSEKWQESEKCDDYEDATLDLGSRKDDLETLIDELKELPL